MITRGLQRRNLVYLCRILCALFAVATVWAIVLSLTGGVVVELGGLRLSSRRPRNAVLIALLCATLVSLLSFLPEGRQTLRGEWSHWRHWYASTHSWRDRAWRVISIVASAPALAVAAMGTDVYQWSAGLPLWVDEEMIALNVRDRSMAELAGLLWLGQSAPFGWLVLERVALTVLGTGELAMRAVPLLFGMATVGAAAWVGRRWMGRIAAVMFVLLCWIGPALAHYRFEIKHYTADAFFGLLLPALAAWAIEADSPAGRTRRIWAWWIAATMAHWFANGALLVTPACGVFLCVAVWRRDGRRAAVSLSAGGLIWLASFGLHYLLSVRHTHHNTYLRSIWLPEMLPESLGLTGSVRWFLDRLEPLAFNPGGTALSTTLWTSAICGWAFGLKRPLGFVLAAVPLSAFAFAPVVPLHQRFTLWMVPALYAGVALLIDRAVALGKHARARRRWTLLAVAIPVLLVQFRLCSDIVTRGRVDLDARRHSTDKHRLDDRAAVRWLMGQWQPGDALITTQLALPAVWWYWMIRISDEAGAGRVLPDGSPIYEVGLTHDCPSRQLEEALKHHRRVLLYLGFDVVPGYDYVLLRNLARLGGVTAHRRFGQVGRAAVIDLRMPASGSAMELDRTGAPEHDDPGCVSVRRAVRW